MSCFPDDIWYLICTQLSHQRSFTTLFNCACSSKQLAVIALPNLYRMHHVAQFTNGGSDEKIPGENKFGRIDFASRFAQEVRVTRSQLSKEKPYFKKWTSLWRTIILSSLGKTLYPYSQYIQTLHLHGLEKLLTDFEFNARVSQDFFQGELEHFKVDRLVQCRTLQLDVVETITRIGEVITKQTPLLEELTGRVHSRVLSQWIPRLPQLKRLKRSQGAALGDEEWRTWRKYSSTKGLDFWDGDESNSDQALAAFFNRLRPQSLESFQAFGCFNFGPQSFQALNCHGKSLTELWLYVLMPHNYSDIPLLRSCTNLVSLSLVGMALFNLYFDDPTSDTFLETVAWVKECKQLRILSLRNFSGAYTLMTHILSDDCIHLTSLECEGEGFRNTEKFLKALANQTSLQHLWFKGSGLNAYNRLVADALVESLSNLVNLTNLYMHQLFAPFTDRHIMRLARSLPKLEVWWTSGNTLNDDIWNEVASLRSLRSLSIDGWLNFTVDGILDFIEKLGPGNEGLVLALRVEGVCSDLSEMRGRMIERKIAEKVGGKFEFRSVVNCMLTLPTLGYQGNLS